MKVYLKDQSNTVVATADYPDDRPMTDVIAWGSRVFRTSLEPKYGGPQYWVGFEVTAWQGHTEAEKP